MKPNRRTRGGRRALMVPATIAAIIAMFALVFSTAVINSVTGSTDPEATDESVKPVNQSERAEAADANPAKRTASVEQPKLSRSVPHRLTVPAIGVDHELLRLGLNRQDNTVRQPANPKKAGWFKRSVTPGEVGISIIIGYIHTGDNRPGVFSRLGALNVGHKISIRRRDDTVAVFRVTDITSYPKGQFPAAKVYAQTDQPELRMISSGGTLYPKDPPGNVVVSAHLVNTR